MRSALFSLVLLAGCATTRVTNPEPTGSVLAVGETTAVASRNDAADDPAIWRNAADPAASLIVATDKQAGLNVYGLDGKLRSSFPAGRVNNVDLREVGGRVIVAASDRNDVLNGKLALYELDTANAQLRELARVPASAGEAYGLCLYRPKDGLHAFIVFKDGTIRQFAIDGAATGATLVRTMKLATQSEGCVADDRTGQLYVGEEAIGVWRFGANASDPVEPVSIAKADGRRLVIDIEGVAIAAEGADGGYLVVSSQGDNAFALWRLPELSYAGRVRIGAGTLGAVSVTDGIEVSTAGFPGFDGGLMIAQDGENQPKAQNFKLVRWADILGALPPR